MATASGVTPDTGSAPARWVVRIVVLGGFALTLWLCGPRAAEVLAAKFRPEASLSPHVELDRVGFVARPEWMDTPLLLAVSAGLAPWLHGEIAILDEESTRELVAGLRSVAWVHDVGVERVFPDRFRVRVELRRPVLSVRDAEGTPLCLVDRQAVVLPWVDTPLPTTFLHREGGAPTMANEPGKVANDARVKAAAAIAVEWRDAIAPLVASCPRLVEVDATNLGERWLRGPEYPEIRVKLARNDGAAVVFAYDRPVDSARVRVPAQTKATVLGNILGKHPGLEGLVAGDLRLVRRWADYLQPRASGVRDPIGPWKGPGTPSGG